MVTGLIPVTDQPQNISPAASYYRYMLFTFTIDHTEWSKIEVMVGATVQPDVQSVAVALQAEWDPRSETLKFNAIN